MNIGKIVQVIGPVVDVEFPSRHAAEIALAARNPTDRAPFPRGRARRGRAALGDRPWASRQHPDRDGREQSSYRRW